MGKAQDIQTLNILVVDDSAYNRKMIRSMLMEMEEIGTVDAVSDGEEAIRAILSEPPDVITLDLNMPRMDGFTFLRWLMRNNPLPVIVVSSEGGEKNVFKALDLGALEFVVKPLRYASERIIEIKPELHEKVRAVARKNLAPYLERLKARKAARKAPPVEFRAVEIGETPGILVVGASTGGPSAIQRVLSDLPADYPLPVLVVQHMPPIFTRQFSVRLDRNTELAGKEAEDGDRLEPGRILVSPGGFHMIVRGNGEARIVVKERKPADRYVPSVDVTMSTAADVFGPRTIGVLLTGMGNDGAEGLLRIAGVGGRTIAESEESAIVFGMPRAAAQLGAAQSVLHLDMIPQKIMDLTSQITRLKKEGSGATK